MPDSQLNAVLVQRIQITPSLAIVRVAPDGWKMPEFKAGQFAALGLPGSAPRCEFSDPEDEPPDPDKLIRRAYSISSASVNRDYVEFYITLVRSGALTPRLFALTEGDRLFLSKRFTGSFTMDMVPKDQRIILLGTGTGLAPYMSMLRSELICNGPGRVVVVHGAYHSWDLGYRSELNTLATICRNMVYLPSITSPEQEHIEWRGPTGFIQDMWRDGVISEAAGFEPTPGDTHIFLCGNPGMIDAMVGILTGAGFREHTKKTPGQIHLERYW